MKSPISKLAVAAVVVFAVMIGVNQFGGSIGVTGVAWAEVARKIDLMPTVIHREKRVMTCDGKEIPFLRSDVVKYFSPEYGLREDVYNEYGLLMHQVYILWPEKASITIQPALKQYKVVGLTNAELEQFRITLKQIIQPIKSGQYTELGRKTIDGIEVEGIEIRDPNILAGSAYPIKFDSIVMRLWADVRTSLLFRVDGEAITSDKYVTIFTGGRPVEAKIVADEYQWDVELSQSIFEPNIQDNYTLMSDETDSYDEGKAVLGLQNFAKLTQGKYPSSLNLVVVMQEACESIKDTDIDSKMAEEEINKTICEIIKVLRPSCLFYAELLKQNKDVVYYGDTVTVEDTDAALMRWKISDDEYRVIFGDLTAENIPAEQLAELEGSSSE